MTSSGDLNIRILKQYIDIKVNVNKEIKVINLLNDSIIQNKIIEHLKDFNLKDYRFEYIPALKSDQENVADWISNCNNELPHIYVIKNISDELFENNDADETLKQMVNMSGNLVLTIPLNVETHNLVNKLEKKFEDRFDQLEKSNEKLEQSNQELKNLIMKIRKMDKIFFA